MKLHNAQTNIPAIKQEGERTDRCFTYADLIVVMVDRWVGQMAMDERQRGISRPDNRLANRICEKCEPEDKSQPEVLSFSSEQAQFLLRLVNEVKWPTRSKDVETFLDAIEAADQAEEVPDAGDRPTAEAG